MRKYIAPEILPGPIRMPKGMKELADARADYDLQVACCICSATNLCDRRRSVAHLTHDVAPPVLPRCVVTAIVHAYRVIENITDACYPLRHSSSLGNLSRNLLFGAGSRQLYLS